MGAWEAYRKCNNKLHFPYKQQTKNKDDDINYSGRGSFNIVPSKDVTNYKN